MLAVVWTSTSGWVLIVLLIATIVYPFLLRRGWLGPVQPFLRRMRLHALLGYSIAGIGLLHAWVPMSAGFANRVDALGLYLATGAWLLVLLQVGLGMFLSQPKLGPRRMLRRWHFWVMVGLATLVVAHVVLNSGTLQMLVLPLA
jgi:hypothetical protein